MILEIKKYGNPVLKKKAEEVAEITPEITELIFNMIETMRKKQGIGLAAPQIGVSKRVMVVETENGTAGFINPKIIKKTKENQVNEEGCLCLPGLFLKIKRAKGIELETLDEKGNKIQIKAEGFLSRIFQHEIDHLDGVLFVDRISFWQRFRIRKKLRKINGFDR